MVAPATSDPGPTSTGTRLAGQHRLIDGGVALDDDAVGWNLLAGANDQKIARHHVLDGNGDLYSVAQHVSLFRAEVEQRPNRRA